MKKTNRRGNLFSVFAVEKEERTDIIYLVCKKKRNSGYEG